ncbi:unnamed protein product, partial [Staurois parvus]
IAACCPRPLPSGRLLPFARGPCPVIGCHLLPEAPAQCLQSAVQSRRELG